jgi:ADP-ribose pyrophosphatase YjhB (NUDIX family)
MSEDRFSVATYAVIANERGQVLLTRRRCSDTGRFPAVASRPRRPHWEAFVREVREETGLDVERRRLVGIYGKRRERDLVFVFAASAIGGELRRRTNVIESSSSIRASCPSRPATMTARGSATP